MISIKSEREIDLLRKAGNIVYESHKFIKPYIKPGITTNKLNDLVEEFIVSKDAYPSCKGYDGFPKAICISINEEVVHGIPSSRVLKEGDIVTLDICACYKGYHGDSGWTYKVGKISKEKEYLMYHTQKALYEGLKQVKPGNYLQDVSKAIEKYAKANKLGIVKELTGHGIGTDLHEDPDIPNYNPGHKGPLLKKGMVMAIEPMLTFGRPDIIIKEDNWTIETEDYSPSAHFEHTIAITDDGCEILTGVWDNGKE